MRISAAKAALRGRELRTTEVVASRKTLQKGAVKTQEREIPHFADSVRNDKADFSEPARNKTACGAPGTELSVLSTEADPRAQVQHRHLGHPAPASEGVRYKSKPRNAHQLWGMLQFVGEEMLNLSYLRRLAAGYIWRCTDAFP
jgi:hypothetical protein